MGNPYGISWEKYFTLVNETGFKLRLISPKDWSNNYVKHISEDNALYLLKDMYADSVSDGEEFRFESKMTQQRVQQLGIKYPDNYVEQIRIYLNYLKDREFIKESIMVN